MNASFDFQRFFFGGGSGSLGTDGPKGKEAPEDLKAHTEAVDG